LREAAAVWSSQVETWRWGDVAKLNLCPWTN
jgi:hypothetical protein